MTAPTSLLAHAEVRRELGARQAEVLRLIDEGEKA